jgi:cell division protein FtsQ
MARIPSPFKRSNDRRKRTRTYDSTTAMRLGIDLTNLARPERSRPGRGVPTSQVDLRRKRTRAHSSPVQRVAPTVMVRNVAAGQPSSSTGRTAKTRRRYDIAMGMPGTEVRLPNLPQISISWRWLSAVLTVVLGFALYQVWNATTFRVAGAEVNGVQRVTAADVNNALGIQGKPVFSLDAGQLQEQLLQAFPEFSFAAVQIGLPNTVSITVTERLPLLAWRMNGNVTLVDDEGMGFPARGDVTAQAIPVVEASALPPTVVIEKPQVDVMDLTTQPAETTVEPEPVVGAQPFTKPEFVSAVLTLKEQAPESVPLLYDGARGFGWRDPGGWDVFFGDARDMAMKLLVYQKIIARLDDKEETLPSLVSVENVHAPYYRPR